jgi:hypothetical protein
VQSSTRHRRYTVGVPGADKSGRPPAYDSQSRGRNHTVDDDRGRRVGPAEAAPRHPLLLPRLSVGQQRQAVEGSRADPGPRIKGRRPAVYTSRCTALSVFRFPCSFFAPAPGSGTVTVPFVNQLTQASPAVVGHVTHRFTGLLRAPTPRRRVTVGPLATHRHRWLVKGEVVLIRPLAWPTGPGAPA